MGEGENGFLDECWGEGEGEGGLSFSQKNAGLPLKYELIH